MDISHEAYLYPFSIGPSTVFGRAIAFKILFCKSMSHFRQNVFNIFMIFISKVKKILASKLWWLHPRNPQGILTIIALLVFLLKRYGNVKVRAKSAYRKNFWSNMMKMALTYEEWAHAAKMIDRETPRTSESHLYDEELVRNKLQELKHRRQEGSLRDIIFFMRADLFRNLGNMCNPELHKGRLQMPDLIKEYINEVSMQLRMVCESDSEDLVLEEKLAFMHETRHAFGRTALLLSGGASLGAFHVGVVKTLIEHKLLPRIIAGSSAGSVTCAVVATRSWPELQSFFEDSWYSLSFFDQMGGIFTVVKRVMRHGAIHEIRSLQILLRNLTCNLTFQEAYDLTGRVLGITVCSPRKHEPSRLLNYLTSPHVVIWSAVTASCAFPGLFEAQELMAKNRSGELVSYHPPFHLDLEEGLPMPARRWRDGGLENDLPKMQLKELFNVNHFIVSQTNPHTSAILRMKEFLRAYGGNFAAKLAHIAEMEVKHRCNQMLEVGLPFRGIAKVFAQDWEGDITVVVPATPAQYFKLIQNMTHAELQKAANQGRRCIWEKLSAIKAHCGIELALDECVAILNHMRRLKRSAQRAAAAGTSSLPSRFSASKRIPSWNCISRENSIASLEDLEHRQRSSSRATTGEGGSSDTETEDHSSCWTHTGGPLMRTSSADTFVDFLSLMKVNVGLNRTKSQSQMELDQRSIVVPEGDLLQPEKIHNGILFNVVKREDVSPVSSQTHNNDWTNQCGRCCGEEEEVVMDITPVSESGDDDVVSTRDSAMDS